MEIANYIKFENCVAKIFQEAGYSVKRNIAFNFNDVRNDIDIIAEKNDEKYCVEVKYLLINARLVERVKAIADSISMLPVIVVSNYIDNEKRAYYKNKCPNLILVDISNLLYAVQKNTELRNELIASLNYSVDNIEPEKSEIEINSYQHSTDTNSLLEEIKSCQTGRKMSRTYEDLCRELLINIFVDDLALWKEQQNSNKELYRFDLLCRIKDGTQKTFWKILERFFNSKYVVFEFKNYNDPVTQKEIYTTEKYLYAKALRCVAIIVSQNGYDQNAYWAAKGCLRENGKLLILLKTDDLIEMNRMKEDMKEPADYLLNILDGILLELEK